MGDSYIEKKTAMMHQLLWTNFLREWVETSLWAIPYVGPFLKFGPVDDILMYLIETYLEGPLFLIVTRWGVFTSIDWQEAAIYNSYEAQAEKLIPLQDKKTWDDTERQAFRDAARSLIRINIRS